MSLLHGLRARLRSAFFRRAAEGDLAEEISFHLELETERLVREGVAPGEARRRAYVAFGGVERYVEEARDGRRLGWVEDVWRDLRLAGRGLARRPGLAAAAVVSLGVGIGLTASMFAVVDSVFYRPLPVPEAGRLVAVYVAHGESRYGAASYPEYLELREHTRTLEGLTAFSFMGMSATLRVGGAARQRRLGVVAGNFFDVLRLRPVAGRFFLPDEDRMPDADPVAVVSYDFWRRELGGDAGAIGSRIKIDRRPFTVIGVAPRGFAGPMPGWGVAFNVYIPMGMRGSLSGTGAGADLGRTARWGTLIGRMRTGVTLRQVRAELAGMAARLARAYPETDGERTVEVGPLRGMRPDLARGNWPMLLALMGVVLVVLLISCANVAGLLLVRAAGRRREVGIRLSLGAGRAVLIRALLAESMLLALLGGVLGVLLAEWGTRALRVLFMTPVMVRLQAHFDVSPDVRVLAFTAAIALASGLLSGLLPALASARLEPLRALRGESRPGGRRPTTGAVVVVVQVALAVLLLTVAGVFLRGMQAALAVNPGFHAAGVWTAWVSPHGPRYDSIRTATFQAELLRRLRASPGIEAAGLGSSEVLGFGGPPVPVGLPGEAPGRPEPTAYENYVTPELTGMLGVPLLRGRALDSGDRAGAPAVAVVSAALARRLWPRGDALGKHFVAGGRAAEVVGIVADAKYVADRDAGVSYIFLPFAQQPAASRGTVVYLRPVGGDGRLAAAALAGAVRALDPDVPFDDPTPLTEALHVSLTATRIMGVLASASAALALVLAAIGLFALLAFAVARRTREIGVRMALGARGGDVRRVVARQGLVLVGIGMLIGVPAGLAAWRILRGLVEGVGRVDAASLGAVVVILAAVALAATWIPARRAARADPMVALRAE